MFCRRRHSRYRNVETTLEAGSREKLPVSHLHVDNVRFNMWLTRTGITNVITFKTKGTDWIRTSHFIAAALTTCLFMRLHLWWRVLWDERKTSIGSYSPLFSSCDPTCGSFLRDSSVGWLNCGACRGTGRHRRCYESDNCCSWGRKTLCLTAQLMTDPQGDRNRWQEPISGYDIIHTVTVCLNGPSPAVIAPHDRRVSHLYPHVSSPAWLQRQQVRHRVCVPTDVTTPEECRPGGDHTPSLPASNHAPAQHTGMSRGGELPELWQRSSRNVPEPQTDAEGERVEK